MSTGSWEWTCPAAGSNASLAGRGPGPGDLCPGPPLLPPLPAGNLPARLVVPDTEKHLPDLLPATGARVGDLRRRDRGRRSADVPRLAGAGQREVGGSHGPRAGAHEAPRRIQDTAPARRGRRAAARGGGADHGLPHRHGEVADLPRQGAAAGTLEGLRRGFEGLTRWRTKWRIGPETTRRCGAS